MIMCVLWQINNNNNNNNGTVFHKLSDYYR